MKKYVTYSYKIYKDRKKYEILYNIKIIYVNKLYSFITNNFDGIIGWGYKENSREIREIAKKQNKKYIAIEEGLIRSIEDSLTDKHSFSYILDDIGIYYDRFNSKFKKILDSEIFDSEKENYSKDIIYLLKKYQISKYNNGLSINDNKLISLKNILSLDKSKNILVVDQIEGDSSLYYGKVTEETIEDMIKDIEEYIKNDYKVYLKIHPETINNKNKKNLIYDKIKNKKNVIVINENINIHELLEYIQKVLVFTSQVGFESLFYNKEVYTYGISFYSNYGLTIDKNKHPIEKKIKLENIVYIMYVKYMSYMDLNYNKIDFFELIEILSKELKQIKSFEDKKVNFLNFPIWKHKYIKNFISKKINVFFDDNQKTHNTIVWGEKNKKNINSEKILTMEDGFIRSIGLGVHLEKPFSLVLDKKGIYYNTKDKSELEEILLNSKKITNIEKKYIEEIIKSIVENKISKYNYDSIVDNKIKLNIELNKKKILIIGQVEDDESLKYGSLNIKTNLDLIKKVKELNNNEYLIYKPHPDIVYGVRKGKVEKKELDMYIDYVSTKENILDLIDFCDEIHVITSTTGLEAIIRNKKVVTYGKSFYSEWGFTKDIRDKDYIITNRKKISKELFLYKVLVEYPIYVLENNFVSIKQIINHIIKNKKKVYIKNFYFNLMLNYFKKFFGK